MSALISFSKFAVLKKFAAQQAAASMVCMLLNPPLTVCRISD